MLYMYDTNTNTNTPRRTTMNEPVRGLAALTDDMFGITHMTVFPVIGDHDASVFETFATAQIALRMTGPSLTEFIQHRMDELVDDAARIPFPRVIPEDDDVFEVTFVEVVMDVQNFNPDDPYTPVGEPWSRTMTFAQMAPAGGAAWVDSVHRATERL